jgi:CysZ protein
MKAGQLKTLIVDFAAGFLFLPRGLGYLLGHRSLWPYAVMPLVINSAIITALGVLAVIFFPDLRNLLWSYPASGWLLQVLWYGASVLLGIVMVLALFVLFIILSGVIAGPFNSKLSRYTRESLSGKKLDPAGGIYVDVILTLLNEVKKLFYFVGLQLLILPLNIIPVVGNLAYIVIGGYLTWMFLAYAFLEYAIEQEDWVISMRQRRQYMRARRGAALGFGSAVSLVFLIPIVDLFLAPVAVVGAAMLYEGYGGQKGLPFHPDAREAGKYPPKEAGKKDDRRA